MYEYFKSREDRHALIKPITKSRYAYKGKPAHFKGLHRYIERYQPFPIKELLRVNKGKRHNERYGMDRNRQKLAHNGCMVLRERDERGCKLS